MSLTCVPLPANLVVLHVGAVGVVNHCQLGVLRLSWSWTLFAVTTEILRLTARADKTLESYSVRL